MRNHTNTINHITNTLVLFFALLGISSNALAQDYTCPVNASERDQRVRDMSHVLEDDVNGITTLTGYKSYDEAQLYCDQTIKENTSRVNELHIDDYDGTLAQMKREKDEAKTLLEHQTATCNACLASKRDAYEKKFIKKHGDHRYDTKGYRTKVVVVWGEAEHEPMTRKQEQYIQHICNYLDMDFPNVVTKDDACAWLEEHVPEYELEIIKSEAFMCAFHEDAGDRGD